MASSRQLLGFVHFLAALTALLHGAPAAAAVDVTFERNGYQGHMEVVDATLTFVADLPPGPSSHDVPLATGDYWLQVARNTDTRFPFRVDEGAPLVTLLRPGEGAAAIVGATTVSLATATVDFLTSSYAGDWDVLEVADGRGANVVTPLVLVKHLSFVVELAQSTSARFSVIIDETGAVSVDNPGAASVSGSAGSGFDVALRPATIQLDPSSYAGGWEIKGVTDLQSGAASVDLVRALAFAIVLGEHIPGGVFQLFVATDGTVSTDNAVAAQGAGDTVTFNTVTVSVDSGGPALDWAFRTHVAENGAGQVDLPPGLEYRLERNFFIQLVEVDEPCAVSPQSFTLSGADFRVRCGTLNAVFHADSTLGDDAGDGSLASPWRTLARLNAVPLFPGDTALLRRGSVFRERLLVEPEEDGTAAAPIVIDAYGEGPRPVVSAGELIPIGDPRWDDPDGDGVYRLPLGPTSDYYTCCPALVRASPSGVDTYALLARSFHTLGQPLQPSLDALGENSYLTNIEFPDGRVLYYRPVAGTSPADSEFELSRRNVAILVEGDHVEVGNVEAILGNVGHSTQDPPIVDGTVQSHGANTVFRDCTVAFGRADGLVVTGPASEIDGCTAEHNHSTGLYVFGQAAIGSVIRNSVSRFNGNLETIDLDRGGIGVQSSDVVVRGNVVHDNGNVDDATPPRIAGDAAIGIFEAENVLVERNFVYNSARAAISASYGPQSHGHRIVGNVIYNWNLVGDACDPDPVACPNSSALRSAISVAGFGDTASSGLVEIVHNTIYSDRADSWIYGIDIALPTDDDWFRDSRVVNNIVYLPDNTDPRSVGLRAARSHHFDNVEVDYNDVLVPLSGNNNYQAFGVIGPDMAALGEPGLEQNSLHTDPRLNLTLANPADPARYDLLPDSPAIDAGTEAGVVGDFLGREVPAGFAPDMGAFESPVLCADADLDGVCDGEDVCPAGPLGVVGLEPPLGPLAPGGEAPASPDRAFKSNRTLPLRLTLVCDGVALDDLDVEAPTVSEIALDGAPLDLPAENADAGESNDGGLSFRFNDGHWVYNLSTRGLQPGGYVVSVATPEGIRYTAAFMLR